ncbi:MAG: membrane lipoprotein lipid attachment site-containing protein [Dermatophilaceae bacterium]|nr:membrane lipoprotein lipid attachment site-containing protein [Dermatophilaceae bacterium]
MRKTIIGLIAAFALAGCSAAPSTGSDGGPTVRGRFDSARLSCLAVGDLADGGKTLLFDTKGKEDITGDRLEDVVCVLSKLGIPKSVTAHMDATRALDGQQTDEWDGIKARWSYHPDSGMRLTLVDAR